MDEQLFSELLNNTRELTIGQIFKLLTKIKYRIMIMFVTTFMGIMGSAYMAGQASIEQNAAVMLQTPFSMRIQIDGERHDFERLTLLEDPMLPSPTEEQVMLSLREIKSAFDIVPLGQVVATMNREEVPVPWRWFFSGLSFSNEAYAQETQPVFNWNGHEGDYKYKEEHVSKYEVHRYYSDGCILGYEVDDNRRSIPSSFYWIERTH